MDGHSPAGPQHRDPRPTDPAPAAPGAEQEGGSGTAGDQPRSGGPSELPQGRGDTPVVAATGAATEGDPPPPPPRKRVQFACPLSTPGCPQHRPVLHQPWPGPPMGPGSPMVPGPAMGPGPFPPRDILLAPLPYTIYTGQPSTGALPAHCRQHPPRDYLVESVLVTLFCCLMTGLMALVYSYETRAALRRGEIAQAYRASKKAWWLILFSFFFGLFVCIIWVIGILVTQHYQQGP